MDRYYNLNWESDCTFVNFLLTILFFCTFGNFMPIVGLLKGLICVIPASIITVVGFLGLNLRYILRDFYLTYKTLWYTTMIGPNSKCMIAIVFPLWRVIIYPICGAIIVLVSTILLSFGIPMCYTFKRDGPNYFIGGFKELFVNIWNNKSYHDYLTKTVPDEHKKWIETQPPAFDIPLFRFVLTVIATLVLVPILSIFVVLCAIIISIIALPRGVYYTFKTIWYWGRIGPNLKVLFTLICPLALVAWSPCVFIVYTIFIVPASTCYTLFVVGKSSSAGLTDYKNVLTFIEAYWGCNKNGYWGSIWKVCQKAWKVIKLFWKATTELYLDYLEKARQYTLPPGEEPFDIKIFQLLFSAVYSIFIAILMIIMFVGLLTIKFVPTVFMLYYHFFANLKCIVCSTYMCYKSLFGYLYKDFCKDVAKLIKIVYYNIPSSILNSIGSCKVFLVACNIIVIPLYLLFAIMFPFLLVGLIVLVTVLLVAILVSVCIVVALISILCILLIPVMIFIINVIVIFIAVPVSWRGIILSYKASSLEYFLLSPIIWVLVCVYEFDFYTNHIFNLEDSFLCIFNSEDSFSCVPCFKISEEVAKEAHIYKIDDDIENTSTAVSTDV